MSIIVNLLHESDFLISAVALQNASRGDEETQRCAGERWEWLWVVETVQALKKLLRIPIFVLATYKVQLSEVIFGEMKILHFEDPLN